jgi:hypothetical protein
MGGALGLAILSTIASSQTKGELGVSAARAITDGFDLAFAVAAIFAFAGLVVAATKLRPAVAPAIGAVAQPEPESDYDLDEEPALAA